MGFWDLRLLSQAGHPSSWVRRSSGGGTQNTYWYALAITLIMLPAHTLRHSHTLTHIYTHQLSTWPVWRPIQSRYRAPTFAPPTNCKYVRGFSMRMWILHTPPKYSHTFPALQQQEQQQQPQLLLSYLQSTRWELDCRRLGQAQPYSLRCKMDKWTGTLGCATAKFSLALRLLHVPWWMR